MRTRLSSTLPPAQWPEADRLGWQAAQSDDPFGPGESGAVMHWRPISVAQAQLGYGRFLDWLRQCGELDPTLRPGERGSVTRLRAYRADLASLGYADATIAGRIRDIVLVVRAIDPTCDMSTAGRGAHALMQTRQRKRNLSDRIIPAVDLFKLGLDLMAKAQAAGHWSVKTSGKYRDGLFIALIACRPLRISNFVAMRVGREIHRSPNGWRFRFPAELMKSGRPYDCAFPEQLVPALTTYLDEVRPVLVARSAGLISSAAFWISAEGNAMNRHTLSYGMQAQTKKAFGRPINPHLVRHIVSTEIAELRPDEVADVAPILAHSTDKTRERHYNHARSHKAVRTLDSILRERGVGLPRKRRDRWG